MLLSILESLHSSLLSVVVEMSAELEERKSSLLGVAPNWQMEMPIPVLWRAAGFVFNLLSHWVCTWHFFMINTEKRHSSN